MQIRSDQTHVVDRSVGDVWAAICRTDDFRSWWPWLRRLEAEGVIEGDEWRCTVQPPLPYSLRFVVGIDEVVDETRVSATVHGDIVGTADVRLWSVDDGCAVRLASVLEPSNRALKVVSTVAPRAARFGHDWVIRTGLTQFRRRAW